MARDAGFKVEGLAQAVRDLQSLGAEVDDLLAPMPAVATWLGLDQ